MARYDNLRDFKREAGITAKLRKRPAIARREVCVCHTTMFNEKTRICPRCGGKVPKA
jgi:rRNA maturation endonuclease Nob1